MKFTAAQIAEILNGTVVGEHSTEVNGLAKIEEGKQGLLSFLSNPKYESYIYTTGSSICIVNQSFSPTKALPKTLTLIKVEDAYTCFAQLLEVYNQFKKPKPAFENPHFIDATATIGKDVYIGAFAYIGKNVIIGDGVAVYPNCFIGDQSQVGNYTVLYAGVKIYDSTIVGSHCIIHAGAVIGSDGFGFAPNEQGVFSKVPQIGNVIIEDDVEIGANTTIDRATMGSTFIRKGCKIDNLCQIAHNVDLGEHTAIAAQVAIAGSTKIGKHVMIGGQAGINGHIQIADGSKVVGRAGVAASLKKADTVMGSPAFPINEFKRSHVSFRRLPQILEELKLVKKELEALKNKKD